MPVNSSRMGSFTFWIRALDAADALRLDVDLIGNRTHSENPPRGSIVVSLLREQSFAGGDDLLIFGSRFWIHKAMQNNAFSTNITWNARGRLLDLSRPLVMGILNVTPDSFFDGNRYREPSRALQQIERMLDDRSRHD